MNPIYHFDWVGLPYNLLAYLHATYFQERRVEKEHYSCIRQLESDFSFSPNTHSHTHSFTHTHARKPLLYPYSDTSDGLFLEEAFHLAHNTTAFIIIALALLDILQAVLNLGNRLHIKLNPSSLHFLCQLLHGCLDLHEHDECLSLSPNNNNNPHAYKTYLRIIHDFHHLKSPILELNKTLQSLCHSYL